MERKKPAPVSKGEFLSSWDIEPERQHDALQIFSTGFQLLDRSRNAGDGVGWPSDTPAAIFSFKTAHADGSDGQLVN